MSYAYIPTGSWPAPASPRPMARPQSRMGPRPHVSYNTASIYRVPPPQRTIVHSPNTYTARSSEQRHPKYFVKYEQESDSGGNTFYEALAQLHIGSSDACHLTKQQVMQFAIRVRATPSHPLHGEYMYHERAHWQERQHKVTLFAALESPDFDPGHHVFWVAAQALRVQIRVYNSIMPIGEAKSMCASTDVIGGVTLYLLKGPPDQQPMAAKFSALVPDRSGRELVEYLCNAKQQPRALSAEPHPDIKRVSWAMDKNGVDCICFNEFRKDSMLQDLWIANDFCRLDTFQVVVSEPWQVESALLQIEDAIERAPSQRRNVRVGKDCRSGNMLPYVSADAEMVKLPREALSGKRPHEVQEMIDDGDVEALVSVLTISVGGRLIVHFTPLHMLENATRDTVPALQNLFSRTILNRKLMKLWWNNQNDILALDNTIAHMYQGSARPSWLYFPYRGLPGRKVSPTFHIHSHHLNGIRPERLEFARDEQECELHSPGKSPQGLACPCNSGNIDIACLLSHFCRQHGNEQVRKLPWTHVREGIKFSMLVDAMLSRDRLAPIYLSLKGAVERSGLSPLDFYQSLGKPGMAADDNVIGYLSGDADVPGRIFESLFDGGDPGIIAGKLAAWAYLPHDMSEVIPQSIAQTRADFSCGIPLFCDNPKVYQYHSGPVFVANDMFVSNEELSATSNLTPWEHDRRAALMREVCAAYPAGLITYQNPYYEPWSTDVRTMAEQLRGELRTRMTDTSKLCVPSTCARSTSDAYLTPIIRANQTSTEALIEHLQCSNATMHAIPPLGFGSKPGTKFGLPHSINRIPGASIKSPREVFEAHRGRPAFNCPAPDGHALGTMKDRYTPIKVQYGSQDLGPPALLAEVELRLRQLTTYYQSSHEAKERLQKELVEQIAEEKRFNEVLGLPGYADHTNLVDPEGREHRRRVEAAPPGDRPNLLWMPVTSPDRTWQSKATLKLEVLRQLK